MFIDGNIDAGATHGTWGSRINTELAVSSPLDIEIAGDYNSTTRAGHANITIIATAPITNTNLKVRIAITESNINRSSPNGTTIHNQTFRDLTPNSGGIALTIANGDTVNLSQAFSCPSPLVQANCDVVVFVQSDSGHRILQGAKRNVMTMTYYLEPFTLISPVNGDTIPTCTTTVAWHSTIDTDSGYAVRYLAYLNFTPSFSNPFLISDTLSDTTWSPPLCVPNDSTYYWKVVAFNGHAPERSSASIFHFLVHEPPSGCIYVTGDINGSNTFNGLDVTYGVGYFKGGPPPSYSCECTTGHSWFVAGDINGSCSFNGLDITYGVAYFKGGPTPGPCPDCPPAP